MQDEDEMVKLTFLFPPSPCIRNPGGRWDQSHHHLALLNVGPCPVLFSLSKISNIGTCCLARWLGPFAGSL